MVAHGLHDLRRTYKTNLRKAGIEEIVRDVLVGHRPKNEMDERYLMMETEGLKSEMLKFESRIDKELAEGSVDQNVDHGIL